MNGSRDFPCSRITLNVNLGGDFEGGELLFGALQGGLLVHSFMCSCVFTLFVARLKTF